jgi:hypothetical protein
MGKVIDLVGQKFGKLTVIRRAEDYIRPNGRKALRWQCKCDCGNEVVVRGDHLKGNITTSCGCVQKEVSKQFCYNLGKSNKKYNTYNLSGEYGIGYTSKGEEFWFDLEDYDLIKDYCWWFNSDGYVVSKDEKRKKVTLHRLVTNCPTGLIPDHIHGHKTRHDNRKMNLRICTNKENVRNKRLQKNNKSGVTGVHFDNTYKKWKPQIRVDGKSIPLGYHVKFESAVKARKDAEDKYFGEFSYDNSMKVGV